MLDALQEVGRTRNVSLRLMEEIAWLHRVTDEAREAALQHRDETAWLRAQVAELQNAAEARQGALLARTEEVAWLRGCVADAEARVAAEVRLRAGAEAYAAARAMEAQTLRSTVAWRLLAPFRLGRRGAVPPPPASPVPAMVRVDGSLAADRAGVTDESRRDDGRGWPALADQDASFERKEPAARDPALVPEALVQPRLVRPPPTPCRAPLTAVHQFHAGSAVGDAITNAMLLIRNRLRAAGFRSEIYVAHRGDGLGEAFRPLDTLPDHDGYVLLLHHSMGFGELEAVLARPARKVLVYHNITPAEMIAIPRIREQAELGRAQLARLQEETVFALADSAFNRAELQALGFPGVRVCPLLFDAEAMLRRAQALDRIGDGVFTVLFVGRVTPSKGQDALVEAFAAFRARFDRPCRLVLAGAIDPDEHGFVDAVRRQIAAQGLAGAVTLTGRVSEQELEAWYRQADLYVSLSRHEGFGVPLAEAMAHGVPVVAWPAGAVPFTLEGAGLVLETLAPDGVADAMLAADRDRAGQAERGRAAVRRWSVERHWPVLEAALGLAGAAAPEVASGAVAANLRIGIAGHFAGSYSLAAVNRHIASLLEAERPGSVRILAADGEMDRACALLAQRPAPASGPELVISGHYPLLVPAHRGDLLAALFFWEESLIPSATVAALNASFAAVFAPSRAVAKALIDSGVAIPVLTIGHAPDLSAFAGLRPRETVPGTFLHVSSAFPRKGVDVLLDAWVRAFSRADAVRLVIKAFPNPHNDAAAQVERIRRDHPEAADIVLVDADLPGEAMPGLYQEASAVVLPSRGEGLNLPVVEAMAAGVPVIVTGRGGHMDFCTEANARLVASRLGMAGSHLSAPHALWAEPDVADLAAAMREAADGALAGRAEAARRDIARFADPAAFAARLRAAAAGLLAAPPAPALRLTWVTSWGVRCGIAEYSRALLDALPREGLAAPVVLADDRAPPDAGVQRAWQLGDGIERLLGAILRADGDLTVIQHQPMLLGWGELGLLLGRMEQAGRPVVVTLHNTAHLLEIEPDERDVAVRGLARAARLLVHTLADLHRLDALGLAGVATLFPHAAPAIVPTGIRALPQDEAPVIGSTGFFLPGKGLPELVEAAARMRARWPGIRLRLVNAEYGDPASAEEIAACRAQAARAGLAVEFHTEFLGLAEQRALLAGCDVIALPYQRSKEGSSAALRSALAAGVPVAVTPIPLFEEAEGAVARLPGLAPAAIELGLSSLLRSTERRAAVVAGAQAWAADRALPDVARRMHGMLHGLAAQRRLGQTLDGSLWGAPLAA